MGTVLHRCIVVGALAGVGCPANGSAPATPSPRVAAVEPEPVSVADPPPEPEEINELCEPLAKMIVAGNDGHFATLKREPDADSTESTLVLPGAASCDIRDEVTATISCAMLVSDDSSEIEESFQEVSELVGACLTEDAWSVDRAEEQRTYWVHRGDDRTSIVEVQVGVGDWESTVSIVVDAVYQ